jgi:hypothetical protein
MFLVHILTQYDSVRKNPNKLIFKIFLFLYFILIISCHKINLLIIIIFNKVWHITVTLSFFISS